MSAREYAAAESPFDTDASFVRLEQAINQKFIDAVTEDSDDSRFDYFTIGNHRDAAHRLGVFCVADTIEPLGVRRPERLRLAIPLERPDPEMPISVLGKQEDAHYFYLTYVALRGGMKRIRVDPSVFASRFNGRRKPAVRDLTGKIEAFDVIPMRIRDLADGFTE